MLEYFLSPAKADLLPTDGGSSARSDPPWLRAWVISTGRRTKHITHNEWTNIVANIVTVHVLDYRTQESLDLGLIRRPKQQAFAKAVYTMRPLIISVVLLLVAMRYLVIREWRHLVITRENYHAPSPLFIYLFRPIYLFIYLFWIRPHGCTQNTDRQTDTMQKNIQHTKTHVRTTWSVFTYRLNSTKRFSRMFSHAFNIFYFSISNKIQKIVDRDWAQHHPQNLIDRFLSWR